MKQLAIIYACSLSGCSDLSMLGVTIGVYVLANLGAAAYNAVIHVSHWLAPCSGYSPSCLDRGPSSLSPREILVWIAHIGFDRMHAVWVKYPTQAIRARATEHTGESHFAS